MSKDIVEEDAVLDDSTSETEQVEVEEIEVVPFYLLWANLVAAGEDEDKKKKLFASFIEYYGITEFIKMEAVQSNMDKIIGFLTEEHIKEIVETENTFFFKEFYDNISPEHASYILVDERAKELIPLHRITSKNVALDDFNASIEAAVDALTDEDFDSRATIHNAFMSPHMSAELVEKIFTKLGTLQSKNAVSFHQALALIVLKMREKDYPGITEVVASITTGNTLQAQELTRMLTVRTVLIEPVDADVMSAAWDNPTFDDSFYKGVLKVIALSVDKNKPVEGWEERVKPIFKQFLTVNYYSVDEAIMSYFRDILVEVLFEKSNGDFDMETLSKMPTPQIIQFFKMIMA